MTETKQLSRREENFEVSSPRDLLQSATRQGVRQAQLI